MASTLKRANTCRHSLHSLDSSFSNGRLALE